MFGILRRSIGRQTVGLFKNRSSLRSFCEIKVVLKENKQLQQKSETILEDVFLKAASLNKEGPLNWESSMQVIRKTEKVFPEPKPTEEELLSIRASRPIATLASIVNDSLTLQKLVDLNVDLWRWERKGCIGMALQLDLDGDVLPRVKQLIQLGIDPDMIGYIFSHAPQILETREEDIKTRVLYLLSKKFTDKNIVHIITEAPLFLTFTVNEIDDRLGFFQKKFHLTGNEVRTMVLQDPGIVTSRDIKLNAEKQIFSLGEELGFSKDELKKILLTNPAMFDYKNHLRMIQQFDVLHTQAKIPHEQLAEFPQALKGCPYLTSGRHKFLIELGKAEYRPDQPNYVNPIMLSDETDEDFCETVARCDIDLYYKFLKTI